jgi:hypothetical protein
MIPDGLLWKDTISGRSESSICVLSKHTGKKRDQLCTQMKLIRSVHIQHPMRGITGPEYVSLSSILVIVHYIHCTYSTQTSHCSNNRFLILNKSVLFRTTVNFRTNYSFHIPIWFKKWRWPQRHAHYKK